MRILVVAERLGRAGGMERYLEIVLPALVERGLTVHVLARAIEDVPPGVVATRVDWADEHLTPDSAARATVARTVRTIRPHVAVAHNVMDAGVVEALREAPRFAYHVHDHRPFCPNGDRLFPRTREICVEPLGNACAMHALVDGCAYGPRRRTLQLIGRRERLRDAIAGADAVVVASAYVGARAAAAGIPRERIATVPLPLPDNAYSLAPREAEWKNGAQCDGTDANEAHAAQREAADANEAAPRGGVVFAGRVVPQKGLDSLIRAVGRIDGERRPVVQAFGTGPQLDAVRTEAAALGVPLVTRGVTPPEDLRAALDGAALLALPSRWSEPFGYVGIEALARGCPVVAYDVGGIRTWLADGTNGIMVPPNDEARLAAAIATLVHDDVLRTAFSRKARDDAETYRLTPIVDRLLAIYRG